MRFGKSAGTAEMFRDLADRDEPAQLDRRPV
jgi:hypothetical protein